MKTLTANFLSLSLLAVLVLPLTARSEVFECAVKSVHDVPPTRILVERDPSSHESIVRVLIKKEIIAVFSTKEGVLRLASDERAFEGLVDVEKDHILNPEARLVGRSLRNIELLVVDIFTRGFEPVPVGSTIEGQLTLVSHSSKIDQFPIECFAAI